MEDNATLGYGESADRICKRDPVEPIHRSARLVVPTLSGVSGEENRPILTGHNGIHPIENIH
jgi:hypothetical protein